MLNGEITKSPVMDPMLADKGDNIAQNGDQKEGLS
jgi:hypothetical protein